MAATCSGAATFSAAQFYWLNVIECASAEEPANFGFAGVLDCDHGTNVLGCRLQGEVSTFIVLGVLVAAYHSRGPPPGGSQV
jgi:hypothetical protein